MTLDEFIAELENTPRTWRLNGGAIRSGLCCPITGTERRRLSSDNWRRIGLALHLDFGTVRKIVHAADNDPGHDRALRARLLAACGLAP